MEKLYYSISEVAEMLEVTPSNLRFWEKEFSQLRPKRNEKGTRFYSEKDIQIIKQIKYLVDDQKLTLEGAKLKLSQKKDEIETQQELIDHLKNLRSELLKILQALNN